MIHKRNTPDNVREEIRVFKKTVSSLIINGYSVHQATIKHLQSEVRGRDEWLKLNVLKGGKS